jgi:hypothetical protein
MRTSPLVGEKVWFGPRRLGWGLEPVSVEGWLITAVCVAAAIWARQRRGESTRLPRLIAIALVAMTVVKGSSPGGSNARRALDAARRG